MLAIQYVMLNSFQHLTASPDNEYPKDFLVLFSISPRARINVYTQAILT